MDRTQLKRRIDRLCELVMNETNGETLLVLLVELDTLFKEYVLGSEEAKRPPPEVAELSNYWKEARRYEPTTEDTQWAQHLVSTISHRGVVVLPSARLVYVVDHHHHTLTLQNPQQLEVFTSFITHVQTIATFERVGYTVNERTK